MIYVASPYSAAPSENYDKLVAVWPALQATFPTKTLYSPILHYHEVAARHNLPTRADAWWRRNEEMIQLAFAVVVVQLPGWEASKGVALERDLARKRDMPIYYWTPPYG